MQPTWRRDGRELFFLATDGMMKAIDITLGTSPQLGVARDLFKTGLIPNGSVDQYAVTGDGQRFVIMNPAGQGTEAPPTIILNWEVLLPRR